ncbi:mechanosensitive ion channel family protein [Ferrimonas balearica]|uniref:mechanosensitive ion channel family protein n=1 Tax=Ferrimonas balearica TaxID=44012 RepID=UPI001C9A1E47|nr:mechanosensitive ion channel family protein [Ferrimonas balearica]MBY5993411.1 mechanosensitive ion channel family protein [Ferrimonas balearica]
METEIRVGLRHRLSELLQQWGLPVAGSDWQTFVVLAVVALLLAWLGYALFRRVAEKGVTSLGDRLPGPWAGPFKQYKVVSKVASIVPLVVLDLFTPLVFAAWPWWDRVATLVLELAILVAVVRLVFAVLDTVQAVAHQSPISRRLPVQSFVQLGKLFLFIVAAILFVSVLLDKSPVYLLSGLGVATGLLLLVFRDTILGFVAGIQLSANRMVSRGDWVQMDKYGADGEVIEVSLTTVKVQNWDKTITMIPAHAMVSDAFRNWRGMQESGGRRIKRALLLDLHSVRFLDSGLEARLGQIDTLRPHLASKHAELAEANAAIPHLEQPANGRRLTNLGCFRAYLQAYLQHHPSVHQQMTLMVRQLAPTENGLPLEIYCFTNDTRWPVYEGIQADIFDHALAVLPQFELRAMQKPTGADLRQLGRPA